MMKRIEEDFGCFFKSNAMLQHVALGFVLIPLKPDVLKLIFDVHETKDRLTFSSSSPTVRMAGHHSLGQRKAAGTAGLAQAFAPGIAGVRTAGYGHAVELHLAGGGKNQHREDDVGVDGGRAD